MALRYLQQFKVRLRVGKLKLLSSLASSFFVDFLCQGLLKTGVGNWVSI